MIHFFLDIDYTISEALTQQFTTIRPSIVLNKEYGAYPLELVEAFWVKNLLYPGAKELVQYLQGIDNATLRYFSAGIKDRNDELVENLHELIKDQNELPKILSREDIHPLNVQLTGGQVITTYPKPIQNFVEKKQVKDAVLIDDNMFSIPQGRRRNLLHVPPGAFNLTSINLYKPDKDKEYQKTEAFQINNKVFYVAGIIARALEMRSSEKNFTRALKKATFELPDLRDLTHYERGLNVLKRINPQLSFFMPSTLGLPLSKKIIKPKFMKAKPMPGISLSKPMSTANSKKPMLAPIPVKMPAPQKFNELFASQGNGSTQSSHSPFLEIERSPTPILFDGSQPKGTRFSTSRAVKVPARSSSVPLNSAAPNVTFTEIPRPKEKTKWFDVPEYTPPSPRSKDNDVIDIEEGLAALSLGSGKNKK